MADNRSILTSSPWSEPVTQKLLSALHGGLP
jgi:hypothetical protein